MASCAPDPVWCCIPTFPWCPIAWTQTPGMLEFVSSPPHLIKISTGRRGEVKLLMVNNGATPHHISTANPLPQVIILPYMAAIFQEVPRLSETIRGTMTFERPQPHFVSSAPHVVSSAPTGPQSPLMSQHSLFGELFPRYIWLWTTYIILYLSIKYFFVSFFVNFVFLFILLFSLDPFLMFECCFQYHCTI